MLTRSRRQAARLRPGAVAGGAACRRPTRMPWAHADHRRRRARRHTAVHGPGEAGGACRRCPHRSVRARRRHLRLATGERALPGRQLGEHHRVHPEPHAAAPSTRQPLCRPHSITSSSRARQGPRRPLADRSRHACSSCTTRLGNEHAGERSADLALPPVGSAPRRRWSRWRSRPQALLRRPCVDGRRRPFRRSTRSGSA